LNFLFFEVFSTFGRSTDIQLFLKGKLLYTLFTVFSFSGKEVGAQNQLAVLGHKCGHVIFKVFIGSLIASLYYEI